MAEGVHQAGEVASLRAGVVPAGGLVGEADASLVDRDHLELPRERRHHMAPRVPGLGPAVHEQQRRTVTADHRVQGHLTGVDAAGS